MEINMINHKNSLYKCHFCQQNIDVYGIENHFATFHNFRNAVKSEYVCEFCDDFEEFHSQTNLFHHIQITHNLINNDKDEEISKVDTLEEGKSKFLKFIVNFNSQEDVFNLLQWIKLNDTNTFLTNNPEIENQLLVVEENTKTNEDDEEEILHDDMNIVDFDSDLDQETDPVLTHRKIIQDQEITVDETFEEDMSQNGDSNNTSDIRIHEDYKCESCDKAFTRPDSLRNHIHTIHEGNKDYKCKSCGKSISHAGDLKRHILRTHGRHFLNQEI